MSVTTPHKNRLTRLLFYLWAAPASAIGCCIAFFAFCLGATWRVTDGVVEVGGGRFSSLVRLLPHVLRFEAITLGHVVLGLNHTVLETHRFHEHIHVRQYERWGILFFPLYLISSIMQFLRGRHPHHCNYFERQACQYTVPATVLPDANNRSFRTGL
jgi:hypothetical protein